MTDRLYRSSTDRVIAGVAGGLAVWLKIDPSLVRIAWIFLAIFSGGIFLIVYLVMMIVVPLAPPGWVPTPPPGPGGAPGGWQGPGGPATPGAGGPGAGAPGATGWTPPEASGSWAPGTWSSTGANPGSSGGAPGGAPAGAPGGWTPSSSGWSSAPPSNQGWSWGERERGNAGIVAGVILVGLGIWFLIDQYVDIDWRLLWPVIVIVVGAALIAAAVRRGRGQA